MSPDTLEVLKLTGSFLGAAAGAIGGIVGGPFLKEWLQRWHLQAVQKQTRWSPLLGAAQELKERLIDLKGKYRTNPLPNPWHKKPGLPTEARDFWELLTLNQDPEPVDTWYELKVDLDARRNDDGAVQRVRVRVHELNYASTSLYMTAKYLGFAQRVRRELEQGRLICPKHARKRIISLLLKVRTELHGTSKKHPDAGVIFELQDSIGESVWGEDDSVISEWEFRKKLLRTPGWEQFLELLRFFVYVHLKLDTEIVETTKALETLCSGLEEFCT